MSSHRNFYKKPRNSMYQGSGVLLHTQGLQHMLGSQIQDALDPVKAPGKVHIFTKEEIAEMERQRKEK